MHKSKVIQSIKVTSDILLSRISPGDANRLFELVDKNRAHLREWLPWLDFNASVQDSANFIKRVAALADENTGLVMLINYHRLPVGIIGYNYIDNLHRNCEIGYWIDTEHQGLGIITRCTKRLIDLAFTDLDLNKVSIPVAVGNTKSRAIPEKLGFQIEGTSREAEWLYDHYVDHVMYAMLHSDWRGLS